MMPRRRTITHPIGGTIDLPLLVPAFSSKGFRMIKGKSRNSRRYSEVSRALDELSKYLNESLLISAYDLHHHHFLNPEKHLLNTSLVFLDSGGYELSPHFDSTEPKILPHEALEFTKDDYIRVLKELEAQRSPAIPLVITNFDYGSKGKPIVDQIKAAQSFFGNFPSLLTDFIIKPSKRETLDIDYLLPHLAKLSRFHIIGVTEKELGKNLLDRLKKIAQLRIEMDRRGADIPLHIWGGLDPLLTPLYFFAGADIFDGVSWLRYSFHKGLAVNRNCFSVLEKQVTMSDDHSRYLSMNKNLLVLQALATSMRAFLDSKSKRFDVFEDKADELKHAYGTMITKIKELNGKEV